MATDTPPRVLHEIDTELAELIKREGMCWALIERSLAEVVRCQNEAGALLDERFRLLDDGR